MQGFTDTATEIARFFTDPSEQISGDRYSILYLLRKDLQKQYGMEGDSPGSVTIPSPLLTCLGIMVGFDLLAILWSGKLLSKRGEENLIKQFLKGVLRLPEDKAEALTQFRNALAHGYRLKTRRSKDQKIFSFIIDDNPSGFDCVRETESGSGKFLVNIWKLKEFFVCSMKKYRRLLEADGNLQSKFFSGLLNFGKVQIR